jgi:hypothetical protein
VRAGATWTSLCRTQRSVPRVTPRAVRSLNRLAYVHCFLRFEHTRSAMLGITAGGRPAARKRGGAVSMDSPMSQWPAGRPAVTENGAPAPQRREGAGSPP